MLPAAVPAGLGASFNVLLVSCFHQQEDRGGLAGNLVAQLPVNFRPHLLLLLGDQVYLDLPTLTNFRDRVDWLAQKFEEDYTANWRGLAGYAQILEAAPSAAIPDDHEYWNNAPHTSPIIQNTYLHRRGGSGARQEESEQENEMTPPGRVRIPREAPIRSPAARSLRSRAPSRPRRLRARR